MKLSIIVQIHIAKLSKPNAVTNSTEIDRQGERGKEKKSTNIWSSKDADKGSTALKCVATKDDACTFQFSFSLPFQNAYM